MLQSKPTYNTDYGYARVAAAVPALNVADIEGNVQSIKASINEAIEQKAQLIVFPEMSITGYTCADLFGNETLLNEAEKALDTIASSIGNSNAIVIVGAPIRYNGHLYNCAVVMQKGNCGLVPRRKGPTSRDWNRMGCFTLANLRGAPFGGVWMTG
ncbi:MAG: NAD(+) synthase, partial [Bacteroidales bacterium]|nr:NAD(+) synthase [Candidatus Sodaliphilus fimicaballi]